MIDAKLMASSDTTRDLVASFLDALRKSLPASAFRIDSGELPRVVISAKTPEIGDLVVTFDDEEITIDIGQITHIHFTPHEGSQIAAERAVGFVQDVLADKVCVRVWYRGGDVAGDTLWYPGEEPSPEVIPGFRECQWRDYVWSGRIKDDS